MTLAALRALSSAEVVVGYKAYLELVSELINGKELVSTGMRKEVERCSLAIERAGAGEKVALVSSGDSGVYGMAGLVFEALADKYADVTLDVDVFPGVTAANSCAALLGAPLMNDWAVISLSDLLTPWDIIERRLHGAGLADFVVILYNPRSQKRTSHLSRAVEILLQYRSPTTPVGIVKNAYRPGQSIVYSSLTELPTANVDMLTTVIIGNSTTKLINGRLITLRGYRL